MKITEIRTFVVGNPWKNWVFVKVFTDEGIVGVGEATAGLNTKPAEAQVQELGRFLIGEDPLHPERLWQRMYKGLFLNNNVAISAIEIACWDILGKTLNAPLWKLLGGKQSPRLRVYANGWYKGSRDPGFFAEAALRVKELGYTALKFDPFGAGFFEMERKDKLHVVGLVEAVRDAVGPDVDILVEMHGRFNPVTAIEMANELAQFKPSWYEEPVPP